MYKRKKVISKFSFKAGHALYRVPFCSNEVLMVGGAFLYDNA